MSSNRRESDWFLSIKNRPQHNLLDRTSCVELKRLQSSLSVSNSKVKIPVRIQRGPTDILEALEQTIPKDSITNNNYLYHDDPYLLPLKKRNYRAYALSYEAGKKSCKMDS